MSPFHPKGSRALRVIVVDLVAAREYDELIPYSALTAAIGVKDDDAGRSQVRQVVSAARPLLLQDHQRALVAVRNRGYRVAQPGEFAGIAQDHRRKSDVQISKALAVVTHAPVGDMSPAERKRHEAVAVVLHNLARRMTDTEERLADLEAFVYDVHKPKVVRGEVEGV